jgi:hypothetical protein
VGRAGRAGGIREIVGFDLLPSKLLAGPYGDVDIEEVAETDEAQISRPHRDCLLIRPEQ